MRLAIVNLTSGGLSGGYLKYLHALLPLLAQDRRISDMTVFLPRTVAFGNDAERGVQRFETGSIAGRRRLREMVEAGRPDVVFVPTSRWMDFGSIPAVVMVRNMEPLDVPFGGNSAAESLRNLGRRHAAWRACRRARGVIAVSSYVADWINTRWNIPRERTRVVYHGVEIPESLPAERPNGLDAAGPFLFTAGSIRPARGLDDIIGALPALLKNHPRLQLVIGGGVDKSATDYAMRLHRRAERLGVAGTITWTGALSAREMRWCFRNCAAFVVTSRAEACPNTVLEAMANGALIVSGSNPPMPEFLGSAAAYYPPGDFRALAEQIQQTLAAPSSIAASRRALARERAGRFSWSRTAEQTVDCLAGIAR